MYSNVMVAVDNSECSGMAVDVAIDLVRPGRASLTGCHVFAADLHDKRFRNLEPGLPERYQQEPVLQRQRDIHDDLIGRGLRIISDAYLDDYDRKCRAADVRPNRRILEGRNYVELLRAAREDRFDLVVLGAHGLGRVDRSIIGSVCERVSRLAECDVLVVREDRTLASGPIVVAVDGSPNSFAALSVAIDLAATFGNRLVAVAAYDPFFHSAAFRSIAGVLSEDASRLFRFQEQEQLHDEIIDAGLMGVYRGHLEEARRVSERRGQPMEFEVLEGKPFDAVASYVERMQPSLLSVGRVGIHRADGASIGSTAENLLRFAACNVLLVKDRAGTQPSDEIGLEEQAETESVHWTEEAEARLKRVPLFVRGMVRKRAEALARRIGQREVTPDLLDRERSHPG